VKNSITLSKILQLMLPKERPMGIIYTNKFKIFFSILKYSRFKSPQKNLKKIYTLSSSLSSNQNGSFSFNNFFSNFCSKLCTKLINFARININSKRDYSRKDYTFTFQNLRTKPGDNMFDVWSLSFTIILLIKY